MGLAEHVVGRRIERVTVHHPRPVRRHQAGPADFADRLTGVTISGAERRGKYLWLPLKGGDAVLAHLGMSGQFLILDAGAEDPRHLRISFDLDDGRRLLFADQRMFGGLSLSPGGGDLPAEVAHIARDPLDPAFGDAAFVARVRRSTSGIKRQLLNQTTIPGVGNIYADEALWLAQVHGERAGERLTARQVRAVLDGTRVVMRAALAQGGTSFDALYVNVNGESGYFDRSLEAYGREHEPCTRCGTPIRRVPFMNRSSYYCPRCQPAPRGGSRGG
jgi:formamidopyrimidine-DNA glycosylase